jgi:hypothetical protein
MVPSAARYLIRDRDAIRGNANFSDPMPVHIRFASTDGSG